MEYSIEYPMLTILMITFDHENYIEEAIKGVFMQNTNFPIELIIAEDGEPTKSNVQIEKILQKAPKNIKVKYTKHTQNKGMIENFLWAYKQTTGKYIALCEGDDYWTDSLKLQKQVDLLEANSMISLCFHSVSILDSFNDKLIIETPAEDRTYTIDEIILTKVAHTNSFVFRNGDIENMAFKSNVIFGGDLIIALLLSEKGEIYGMKSNMGVYRKHAGGITNIDSKRLGIKHTERFVRQFIYIRNKFKKINKKTSALKIVDYCLEISFYYYQRRNLKAILYLFIAIYYKPSILINGFKKKYG